MRSVVITGAGGFIGKALTTALLDMGVSVRAVCRTPEKLAELSGRKGLNVVRASFKEYHSLPELIPERGMDAFIHLAWEGYGNDTNNIEVQSENVKYAGIAAQAAADMKCGKFLLAGSCHEYQMDFFQNDLSLQPGLCSVYGAAKSSAGNICRAVAHRNNMWFTGFFFPNIFGIGDMSRRSSNTFIRKLLRGEPLDLIMGDNLYDWTYVDDAVRGVIAAAEKGKPGTAYYVGGRELRPFRDIVTDVRDILAPGVQLNFGKFPDSSYIDYSRIDIHRLYADTGYRAACDFRESVMKTADWLKSR